MHTDEKENISGKMIKDYDPRPIEYRGSAPEKLKEFVKAVKGKGLGVSVLFDKACQYISNDKHHLNLNKSQFHPGKSDKL